MPVEDSWIVANILVGSLHSIKDEFKSTQQRVQFTQNRKRWSGMMKVKTEKSRTVKLDMHPASC